MDINGEVVVDETGGLQNPAGSGSDKTGNDVQVGVGLLTTGVTAFDTLLQAVVTQNLATTNVTVAVSNGTSTDLDGSPMLSGFGGNVTDLAFTNSTKGSLLGEEALSAPGVPLLTIDGAHIFLYSYTGADLPGIDENNVVFGRKGVWDDINDRYVADPSGDVVFAAYLQPTGAGGAVQNSDLNAAGAKVWLVQFEPIEHPVAGSTATAHDDALSLYNLYVTTSNSIDFSLAGAPAGQNLFMMFGDGTPSTTDTTLIVTGKNPANQSGVNPNDPNDDITIGTGDTVNSGKGGGDTTLGTNSQQIVEGTGLYFTFATGANTAFTVPNLSQTGADVEANIAFTALSGSTGANFSVAQMTSGDKATLEISAYSALLNGHGTLDTNDDTPYSGVDFIDNLHNNMLVEVRTVTITTQPTGHGKNVVPGETLEFVKVNDGDTITKSGITVTFSADTVVIKGLEDKDEIAYTTAGLHNRVLIDNIGSTDSNFDAPFDIGKFGLTNSSSTPNLFSALTFQDDGPSVTVSATNESAILLTTQDAETDGDPTAQDSAVTTVDFSGVFSNVPVYGADGAGTTAKSYALSLYGPNDGINSSLASNGVQINLYNVSGLIKGSTALSAAGITDGNTIFSIGVVASGANAGIVTLTQYAEIDHALENPTTAPFDDQYAVLANNLVKLTGTALSTDGDGDTATDSEDVDLGGNIRFADDGPSVSANATVLLDDDALTGGNPLGTGDDADSSYVNGTLGHVFGADGAGTVAYLTTGAPLSGFFSYVPDGTSLLVKQTQNGVQTTVLTLTMVPGTGDYTVVQNNPILHAAGLTENNQAFTINYRVTDGDGDTADGTLSINVDDDTPVVTAKSNLVFANSSNPPPADDTGGTGVFAYSIGADKHLAPYSATNSDFLSVALLPDSTVGTSGINNRVVTRGLETDTHAVFNVGFTYVSNNPTQGAESNATGTLTFDKVAGTYTFRLDQEIESFSILKTSTAKGFQGYELDKDVEDNSGLPDVSVARLADDFQVQFTGYQETSGNSPEKLTAGSALPTNFAHGELFNGPASVVSVSGIAAGVASDTLQPGEVMDLDFFTSNPKGDTQKQADATSKAIYLKFDGIGLGAEKEDLVVVLKLVDPDDHSMTTRAFIVENKDIIQLSYGGGTGIANPAEYGIVLDQNDGAVIFESNDYNFDLGNGVKENYEIQGAQVLTSTQGLSGTGYNFNGFVASSNVTNDNNGATPNSPQQAFGDQNGEKSNQLDTIGNLAEAATWDGDVIKITDIGFVTSTTPDAHLTFGVVVTDADGDETAPQTLDVSIVGGNSVTASATSPDTFVIGNTDVDGLLSMVTTVIDGGFTSGVDKLDFTVAGTGLNYTESLTPVTNLAAFTAAAETALDGNGSTKDYYFGVVGSDGYLAFDEDHNGITAIIQLVGVTDIASTDIV